MLAPSIVNQRARQALFARAVRADRLQPRRLLRHGAWTTSRRTHGRRGRALSAYLHDQTQLPAAIVFGLAPDGMTADFSTGDEDPDRSH